MQYVYIGGDTELRLTTITNDAFSMKLDNDGEEWCVLHIFHWYVLLPFVLS